MISGGCVYYLVRICVVVVCGNWGWVDCANTPCFWSVCVCVCLWFFGDFNYESEIESFWFTHFIGRIGEKRRNYKNCTVWELCLLSIKYFKINVKTNLMQERCWGLLVMGIRYFVTFRIVLAIEILCSNYITERIRDKENKEF